VRQRRLPAGRDPEHARLRLVDIGRAAGRDVPPRVIVGIEHQVPPADGQPVDALLGGVGGRLEHTFANLQLLDWLTTQGATGFLAGEKTVATALRGNAITFPPSMSGFLSVFCNSGTAEGVDLTGLKFPLKNHTISSSFPLGVSNEFLGTEATVSVREGSLLLLWEDKGDFYTLLPKLWPKGN